MEAACAAGACTAAEDMVGAIDTAVLEDGHSTGRSCSSAAAASAIAERGGSHDILVSAGDAEGEPVGCEAPALPDIDAA